jgi:exodeoxyribonuclease VII large subunit
MINIPQFSVSEFSRSIKRLVEDAFGYVKIKGEISGFKRASSGHLYFSLKDQDAVLSAVCFRNMAQLINFEIGDGLEVVASGKITTFEGRSNYQIIIEKIEIAGIGAILEMIEKRRQKLLSEGLFDEIHKKPIPFFPQKIGVITSPTGAVIEDIKHRISARCPSHIMLFEAAVQGEKAVNDVISGIRFFNRLAAEKRPQVLIIARGGGSIEDLMAFNDENLVREVFKSEIPIISAIGHETDITLIDYVSDLRAPTPSAAAELATPILSDLKNQVNFLSEKLQILPQNFLSQNFQHLKNLQKYIVKPEQKISEITQILNSMEERFVFLAQNYFDKKIQKLSAAHISSELILQKLNSVKQKLEFSLNHSEIIVKNRLKEEKNKIDNLEKIMLSNHYNQILKRGFAVLKNKNGHFISSILETSIHDEISIEMHQGKIDATINSKTLI